MTVIVPNFFHIMDVNFGPNIHSLLYYYTVLTLETDQLLLSTGMEGTYFINEIDYHYHPLDLRQLTNHLTISLYNQPTIKYLHSKLKAVV